MENKYLSKYKVMGNDTFSNEDYPVGEYDTIEEAEYEKRKQEKHALTLASSPSIADTYWIEEV